MTMNMELNPQLLLLLKQRLTDWLASLPADEVLLEDFGGRAMTAGEMLAEINAESEIGQKMLYARLQTALVIGLQEMTGR